MPIHHVENLLMVSPDFSLKEKYWVMLTSYVREHYGEKEIKEHTVVQQVLKECFQILNEEFMGLIKNENKASFYLYVHNFHENSIDLWLRQIRGVSLTINEEDFAATRRILKIVLEQSCGLELVASPNFGQEMHSNRFVFLNLLEELLYLGYWAIGLSEYIARSQLFPNAIGIKIEKDELNILFYQPYSHLFDFVHQDLSRHNNSIVIYNTIIEFKTVLLEHLGIDYDVVASFFNEHPHYRLGVLKLDQLLNILVDEYDYDRNNLFDFFAGLTVSRENYLCFEDCILRNQDINRYVYRPILKLKIDNQDYCIIGKNKWSESLTLLSTNAMPFGICPEEWLKHKAIKKFITNIGNNHDKILENPIIEMLQNKNIKFDNNLKSISKRVGNNVKIENQGIGEIDIMFIDEDNEIIYVVECKHNRSRFDMFNWKRDYSNFKDKYERQLENKVNWVIANRELVEDHFVVKYGANDLNLSNYAVRGIFAINAPTVYMHNGKYIALTLHDINDLIRGNYETISFLFTNEDDGTQVLIRHPYFDNLDEYVKKKQIIKNIMNLDTKQLNDLIKEIKERM